MSTVEIRHFHLFAGLGGGAKGFNRGKARVGSMTARFRCIGGIDVDAAAMRDFAKLAGVPGTVLDLFDRAQYVAFHGKEPPATTWREATPQDVQRAAGGERPHILFLSAPCKGFSGLLSETRSRSDKYQALNRLTLRGMWLAMEAWRDDPPELIVFENVPRIANRGRPLLDQIHQLLTHYGYAVAETTHDCGELGGLAQSRKRFLLVARHREKVPPFLYEPEKKALRAVGEVLGRMPLPGDMRAGPMHRLPALQWKTWVRLAFVEAGSDWRSLQKLDVRDGVLSEYLLVPELRNCALGVNAWSENLGTVQGESLPYNGNFSVQDPRIDGHEKSVQFGVRRWDETAGVVTGKMFVGGGPNSIADPRLAERSARHNNVYRVVRWSEASPVVTAGGHPTAGGAAIADPRVGYSAESHINKLTVIGWDKTAKTITAANQVQGGALSVADPRGYGEETRHHVLKVTAWDEHGGTVTASRSPGGGALSVADPRPENWPGGKYRVTGFDEPANAVIAASTTGNGAFAVADPRPEGLAKEKTHRYHLTGGHYGVVPWSQPANVVAGQARHDNGFNNVADPRVPAADERVVALIVSLDGTWHRPFTTFELAGLQSLVDPEEQLALDGLSDSAWRERIGNAVPPEAAEAIAGVMGTTLLLAWSGETFALGNTPIWVRQVAVALSVRPA